jgi:two-component system cell cycle response regulator DivK
MFKKTILIVDDNEINIKLLEKVLESKYDIISVRDGEMAVEKAKEIKPPLIIMDVAMPKMDGITATKLLKNDSNTKNIAIILITAHSLTIDKEKIKDSGCDEFITRPIKMNELIAAVEKYLR